MEVSAGTPVSHSQKRLAKENGLTDKLSLPFKVFVALELDMDLAIALGNLILGTKSKNTALLALGHQLAGS